MSLIIEKKRERKGKIKYLVYIIKYKKLYPKILKVAKIPLFKN